MRSITNSFILKHLFALAILATAMFSCSRPDKELADAASGGKEFVPFTISDSSKIVSYPDGLRLYVVSPGPGDYPINGTHLRMHYYGVLQDGTVFDETFSDEEPFKFTIGSHAVIPGIEEAVKKLRVGSKAIAIIPPQLGYGEGQGKGKKELPPKIPANATLIFHLELIGTF